MIENKYTRYLDLVYNLFKNKSDRKKINNYFNPSAYHSRHEVKKLKKLCVDGYINKSSLSGTFVK